MTLNIIATVFLAYFVLREALNVYRTWRDGYDFMWVVVGAVLVGGLLAGLYAVWR